MRETNPKRRAAVHLVAAWANVLDAMARAETFAETKALEEVRARLGATIESMNAARRKPT